jgi:hypothetical protein
MAIQKADNILSKQLEARKKLKMFTAYKYSKDNKTYILNGVCNSFEQDEVVVIFSDPRVGSIFTLEINKFLKQFKSIV